MSSQNRTVKQIGQYQYNERHCLGEGAYGKVYQGMDIKTNEIVGIKKMDLVLFERDTYLRNQIVSEIEILKKFNHPNIVRFIDLITTQRSLYIITEFCKDGDLKEFLQKRRLSEKEAQGIMLQIINGFKELVKQGVIHRDLKPANILNHEGIVKIADFGFAKYVDNYTSQLLRSCVGSPLYMAPQILQRKSYSTKCDIWSIGVIFYEMVFHDVPWKGRDEQDLLKNILIKPLVFKGNQAINDFTRDFLTKALIVDESERISWDQVFQMFESMEKGLVSNNPTLQKLYNDQNLSWMQKQQQKMTGDQLVKQLQFLQQMKQNIAFRHFVNLELYQKLDQLKLLFRRDQSLEECIVILSRLVLAYSNLLVQLVEETCDSGEDILMKGTKWNILNFIKNEQEYYKIFFSNCKEQFFKEIQYEVELSDSDRNKLEDNFTSKIIKLIGDILDDLKKKSSEGIFQDSLIALELLLDQQITHKNIVKTTDLDFQMLLVEKQQRDDWRKILDRITVKWRQLQKL
ncbi:unnamed protein product [Paramecium sonneborni]|uniref:Protein kinase domain-containing protein n=1 Tax=Paramecium sonneborni TaxID=65129 RepID=A0A8S1MCC3_9CILI|nr:unnamed protein product [Paramecium sonneborni]